MISDWNQLPVILTVKEAADVAKISYNKLYQMTTLKGFPAQRFGRSIRIPRDAFKVWMEKNLRV